MVKRRYKIPIYEGDKSYSDSLKRYDGKNGFYIVNNQNDGNLFNEHPVFNVMGATAYFYLSSERSDGCCYIDLVGSLNSVIHGKKKLEEILKIDLGRGYKPD